MSASPIESSHSIILQRLASALAAHSQLKKELGLQASDTLAQVVTAFAKPDLSFVHKLDLLRVAKLQMQEELAAIASRFGRMFEEENAKLAAKTKVKEISEAQAEQQRQFWIQKYQAQRLAAETQLSAIVAEIDEIIEHMQKALDQNQAEFVQDMNRILINAGFGSVPDSEKDNTAQNHKKATETLKTVAARKDHPFAKTAQDALDLSSGAHDNDAGHKNDPQLQYADNRNRAPQPQLDNRKHTSQSQYDNLKDIFQPLHVQPYVQEKLIDTYYSSLAYLLGRYDLFGYDTTESDIQATQSTIQILQQSYRTTEQRAMKIVIDSERQLGRKLEEAFKVAGQYGNESKTLPELSKVKLRVEPSQTKPSTQQPVAPSPFK